MLPKMRYRLGLDLGTTSIGWAMIRLDKHNKPVAIIRMGVRIFSDGRNPKDGSSLAVTRRNARQMRRRRDRLLKRKQKMLNALINHNFFPSDPIEREALSKLNPYELRAKGLDKQLTPAEFARALFHLNQRRGFKSNRKTDRNDNENSVLKKAIKDMHVKLQAENCRTLGEWLAIRHKQHLSVRARLRGKTQKDKAYDYYADRSMIEHEFETLWNKQAEFAPSQYSQNAYENLKNILLFQRPLNPVDPGRCTLLPKEQRAAKAMPSTQRFRMYQEVNNLRLLNQNLSEQPLTLEQRDIVIGLLEKGDATFKKIRSALSLSASDHFNLEDIKRDRLFGNKTSKTLSHKKCFGTDWFAYTHELQDEIVDKLLHEGSEPALIDWLEKHTSVNRSTALYIANVNLLEGYGNLSLKALKLILPELQKAVIPYSEAVDSSGLGNHSALSYAENTGELMQSLPYYGIPLERHVAFGSGQTEHSDEKRYGRIANPTVHIGLNELRKVVNALIDKYGHPSEVILEVARDLKLSHDKKREIQKDQAERQKRNTAHIAEACQVLGIDPDNIDKAKRRELSQKMQLWFELDEKNIAARRCPYSGEHISIEKLLSNEIEIEHILPFSKTLDDSLNNKTVSLRKANRIKGNRSPHEAFGENREPGYNYDEILLRANQMKKAKAKRFAPDAFEQWLKNDQDFIARALNDTAYFSRIAKEYLSLICPPNKVRAIPGRLTAMLRGKFGLNQLLSGTEAKNRDDHRHHALDAAVISITDQGLLQRFASASAKARELELNRLVEEMPLPWSSYRQHVERALAGIHVSHRPDHGYQGAMHEDSAWGIDTDGFATRKIFDENSGERQKQRKKLKLVEISSTKNKQRHGTNEDGSPKNYKGYVGGSNYCIEIWADENNKWRGDVISTYSAYQVIRQLGEEKGSRELRNPTKTQRGKPLIMRLMINDYVKLKVQNSSELMRVATIKSSGQMLFSAHNEANADARNRDKANPFSYISKTPGSLQKAQGIHCRVSPLGTIYPSKNRA